MGPGVELQGWVDSARRDYVWAKARPVWPVVDPILAHAGVLLAGATFFRGLALISLDEH